jgi:hypothetical protein
LIKSTENPVAKAIPSSSSKKTVEEWVLILISNIPLNLSFSPSFSYLKGERTVSTSRIPPAKFHCFDELSTTQSEPAEVSERTPMPFSLNQAIPESTTEITTEKKTKPYADIIQYLNEKIGKFDSWKTNQGILPYLTSLLVDQKSQLSIPKNNPWGDRHVF